MGIFSPPYLSLLDLAHHQCDRPKMRPLECEPATHCVLRFASAGSKGSPWECEPATHFVLRFASAGSKGSTQEDVVRGIYDGRTVLDAPALLSGVVLALIPTGNVP